MTLHASPSDNPYYPGMDVYQILEVPRSASAKDIKSAFRKQVMKWHPDRFPNDPEKKKEGGLRMEKINRAYYILEDEDRKRRYDKFGDAGVGTSAASEEQLRASGGPDEGFSFGGGGAEEGEGGGMEDLFESLFGGGGGGLGGIFGGMGGGQRQKRRASTAPVAGEDLRAELKIPFMAAVFGGQQRVKVKRTETCNSCMGSGAKPGSKARKCSACQGHGMVNNVQRTPFGMMQQVEACSACAGSGEQMDDPCASCRGKGALSEMQEVTIKVPAGIEDGTTLRIRDGGSAGKRGGSRGDLFVTVSVLADPRFKRDGADIHSEVEVSYVDAILGTAAQADTVDGVTEVKIPGGSQPGQQLRLKGKGAPKLGGSGRGDAFITIKVKIPGAVAGKEKELLQQIAQLKGQQTKKSGGGGGFFGGFGS